MRIILRTAVAAVIAMLLAGSAASSALARAGRVGYVGLVGIAGAVLAEDERHLGVRRCGDLIVYFFYCAIDHDVAWDLFIGVKDVFGCVVCIDVS